MPVPPECKDNLFEPDGRRITDFPISEEYAPEFNNQEQRIRSDPSEVLFNLEQQ
jgi:hypothetical protein